MTAKFEVARLPLFAKLKAIPTVFLPIARWRTNDKRQVVCRDSDIAIEGYWRCGNHFATYAFMVAQDRPVKVAHHFHAPAQLMIAADWGVPAVLLIREPIEAVASSTVYLEQDDPRTFLRFYNAFYAPLPRYASRLVVSDFSTTVGDFGRVIAAVNKTYNRSFKRFEGTPEQRQRVEQMIREEHENNMGAQASTLPLPSEQKAQAKQRIIERMRQPECAKLLATAQRLYEELKQFSV